MVCSTWENVFFQKTGFVRRAFKDSTYTKFDRITIEFTGIARAADSNCLYAFE